MDTLPKTTANAIELDAWLTNQTERFIKEMFGAVYNPTPEDRDSLLGIYQFHIEAGLQLDGSTPFGYFGGDAHSFLDNNEAEIEPEDDDLKEKYSGLGRLLVSLTESREGKLPDEDVEAPTNDDAYEARAETIAATVPNEGEADAYAILPLDAWLKQVPEWRHFEGGETSRKLLETCGFPIGFVRRGYLICAMSPVVVGDRDPFMPYEAYRAAAVLDHSIACMLHAHSKQFDAPAFSRQLGEAIREGEGRLFLHGTDSHMTHRSPMTSSKLEEWFRRVSE